MKSESILAELREMTLRNLSQCKSFSSLSDPELNHKSNAKSWSILECIEHLNRYGDFYIPEIAKAINSSKNTAEPNFKSGLFGNYFAKSMLPKPKLNKMGTFKSMNPAGSRLDKSVLDKFIDHQNELLKLLEAAGAVNLVKNKTTTSISRFVKLRLGDTLRVVIYHNLRHIEQAERAGKAALNVA